MKILIFLPVLHTNIPSPASSPIILELFHGLAYDEWRMNPPVVISNDPAGNDRIRGADYEAVPNRSKFEWRNAGKRYRNFRRLKS